MSEPQHTPGPWRLVYESDPECPFGWAIEATAWTQSGEEDSATIAIIEKTPDYMYAPEVEANARLIAAAPELLEAATIFLNDTRDIVASNPRGGPLMPHDVEDDPRFEALFKGFSLLIHAVAKATKLN